MHFTLPACFHCKPKFYPKISAEKHKKSIKPKMKKRSDDMTYVRDLKEWVRKHLLPKGKPPYSSTVSESQSGPARHLDEIFHKAEFKHSWTGWAHIEAQQQKEKPQEAIDCNTSNLKFRSGGLNQDSIKELHHIFRKPTEEIGWNLFQKRQASFRPTTQPLLNISVSEKRDDQLDSLINSFQQHVFQMFKRWRFVNDGMSGFLVSTVVKKKRRRMFSVKSAFRNKMDNIIKTAEKIVKLRTDLPQFFNLEQFLLLMIEKTETDLTTKLRALAVLLFICVVFNRSLDMVLRLVFMFQRLSSDNKDLLDFEIPRDAMELFYNSIARLGRFSFLERKGEQKKKFSYKKGESYERIESIISNLCPGLPVDIAVHSDFKQETTVSNGIELILFYLCIELDRLLTEFENTSPKIANLTEKSTRPIFVDIPFVIHKNSLTSLSLILQNCVDQLGIATTKQSQVTQIFCITVFLKLLSVNIRNSNFDDQFNRTSFQSNHVRYGEVVSQIIEYCKCHSSADMSDLISILDQECTRVPSVSPIVYFLDNMNGISTATSIKMDLTLDDTETSDHYVMMCVSLQILLHHSPNNSSSLDGGRFMLLQRTLFDLLLSGLHRYSLLLKEEYGQVSESNGIFYIKENYSNMFSLITLLFLSMPMPILESLASCKLQKMLDGLKIFIDVIKRTPNCEQKAVIIDMLFSMVDNCIPITLWRGANRLWLHPSNMLLRCGQLDAPAASSTIELLKYLLQTANMNELLCYMWRRYLHSIDSTILSFMQELSQTDENLFIQIRSCIKYIFVVQVYHTHNAHLLQEFLGKVEIAKFDDEFWVGYEKLWKYSVDFLFSIDLDRDSLSFKVHNIEEVCKYLLTILPLTETTEDDSSFIVQLSKLQDLLFRFLSIFACLEPLEADAEARIFSWKGLNELICHGFEDEMKERFKKHVTSMLKKVPEHISNCFACYSLSIMSCGSCLFDQISKEFNECYDNILQYFELDHNEQSIIQLVMTTIRLDFLVSDIVFHEPNISSSDVLNLFYNIGCDTLATHCGETYHPSIRQYSCIPNGRKLLSMRKRHLFFALAKLFTSERYEQLSFKAVFEVLDRIPRTVELLTSEEPISKQHGDEIYILFGVLYFQLMIILPNEESIKPGDIVRIDNGRTIAVLKSIDFSKNSVSVLPVSRGGNSLQGSQAELSIEDIDVEYSSFRAQLQKEFFQKLGIEALSRFKYILEVELHSNSFAIENCLGMMRTCVAKVLSSTSLASFIMHEPDIVKQSVSLAKTPLNFLNYHASKKKSQPTMDNTCLTQEYNGDSETRVIDLCEYYHQMPCNIQTLHAYLSNDASFTSMIQYAERRRRFDELIEYLPSLIVCQPELRQFYQVDKLMVRSLGITPQRMIRANYCFPSTCQVISFALLVEEVSDQSFFAFGFVPETHDLNGLPGWFDGSIGYHSDGELHIANKTLLGNSTCISTYDVQSPLVPNDLFLVMFDQDIGTIDVIRNGTTIVSSVCLELHGVRLYPVLHISGTQTSVKLSFSLDETARKMKLSQDSSFHKIPNICDDGTAICWMDSSDQTEASSTQTLDELDSVQVGTVMMINDTSGDIHHSLGRYVVVVDMMKQWDRVRIAVIDKSGKVELLWINSCELTKNKHHPLLHPHTSIEDKSVILKQNYVAHPVLYAREFLQSCLTQSAPASLMVDILSDRQTLAVLFSNFIYNNISRMSTFWKYAEDISSTFTNADLFNGFFLCSSANIANFVLSNTRSEYATNILHQLLKLIDECLSKYITRNGPYCRTFSSSRETHVTEVFFPYAKGMDIQFHASETVLEEDDQLAFSTTRNFDVNSDEGYVFNRNIPTNDQRLSSNKVYFCFKKSPNTQSKYSFTITPVEISFLNEESMIDCMWANPSILLWALNILTRVSLNKGVQALLSKSFKSQISKLIISSIEYLLLLHVPLKTSMANLLMTFSSNILPYCEDKQEFIFQLPDIESSRLNDISRAQRVAFIDYVCTLSRILDKSLITTINFSNNPEAQPTPEIYDLFNLQFINNIHSNGHQLLAFNLSMDEKVDFADKVITVSSTTFDDQSLPVIIIHWSELSDDSLFRILMEQLFSLPVLGVQKYCFGTGSCLRVLTGQNEESQPFKDTLDIAFAEIFEGRFRIFTQQEDKSYSPSMSFKNYGQFEFFGRLLALVIQNKMSFGYVLEWRLWTFILFDYPCIDHDRGSVSFQQFNAIAKGFHCILSRHACSVLRIFTSEELQQYAARSY